MMQLFEIGRSAIESSERFLIYAENAGPLAEVAHRIIIRPENEALYEEFDTIIEEFSTLLESMDDKTYTRLIGDSTIGKQTRHTLKRLEYFLYNLETGATVPKELDRHLVLPFSDQYQSGRGILEHGYNREVTQNRRFAIAAFQNIKHRLELLKVADLDKELVIYDELRSKRVPYIRTKTTMGREACCVIKHTTHHACIIRSMLALVNQKSLVPSFGVATTTYLRMLGQLKKT